MDQTDTEKLEAVLQIDAHGLGVCIIGGHDSILNGKNVDGGYIIKVLPNGACANAGVLPGDIIVSVNGESLLGKAHDEMITVISNELQKNAVKMVFMLLRSSTQPGKLMFEIKDLDAFSKFNADSPHAAILQQKREPPQGLSFGVSLIDLVTLIAEKGENGLATLEELGNVQGLMTMLRTSSDKGLSGDPEDLQARVSTFGPNFVQDQKPKTILELMAEAMQDPVLIILLVAASVSLILGVTVEGEPATGWIDGFAIMFAVFIVVMVSALNDWQKERQFRSLKESMSGSNTVSVMRNGKQITIPVKELVVGDILEVADGVLLPADGIVIKCQDLEVDESALTGESEAIHKSVDKAPFLLAGTGILSGGGWMLVTCVGLFSQEGIINRLITKQGESEANRLLAKSRAESNSGSAQTEVDPTTAATTEAERERLVREADKRVKREQSVLQTKLSNLAIRIGKLGMYAAIFTVLLLFLRFFIQIYGVDNMSGWPSSNWGSLVSFLIIGVTVLVVAVPEGLPLAVTITLAYSVKKMQKDNNLVRVLASCETMGNATAVCSDKTGTLTQNKMTVTRFFVNSQTCNEVKELQVQFSPMMQALTEGIAVNRDFHSKYYFQDLVDKQRPGVVLAKDVLHQTGNKTECSLLKFADDILSVQKAEWHTVDEVQAHAKVLHQFKFDHVKKRMTTIVFKNDQEMRVYVKGAPEIMLPFCTFVDTVDGPKVLTDEGRENIRKQVIEAFAGDALRVIMLAYHDEPNQPCKAEEEHVNNLVLSCLVGIQDPLRPEVPAAVQTCKRAGVTIRMVTGDNILTAKAIAKQCGIVESEDDLVLDGPTFRKRILKEDGEIDHDILKTIIPKLRVIARCSPTDKFNLVKGLKFAGEVVAVTGDGTNDGPALAEADVGFAMGTGTKVAQNASHIILIDDNFASLVSAISWGRNVYDSIAKFLIFQLTVNFVAIIVAIIGAASIKESPLRAIQLLWVNLIMDSFASLALATEPPTASLLNRLPYKRNKPLLSQHMFKQIFFHGFYQLIVCFVILYEGDVIWNIPSGRNLPDGQKSESIHYTMVFNTFVWMQIFNEINSRKCHGELNVFEGIQNNSIFNIIFIGTCIVQAILIEFGGEAFHVKPLPWNMWIASILIGAFELVINVLIHYLVPDSIIPLSWSEATSEVEPEVVEGEAVSTQEAPTLALPSSSSEPADLPTPVPDVAIVSAEEGIGSRERLGSGSGGVRSILSAERLGQLLWHRGLRRLRTQLLVASAFRVAGENVAERIAFATSHHSILGGSHHSVHSIRSNPSTPASGRTTPTGHTPMDENALVPISKGTATFESVRSSILQRLIEVGPTTESTL